MRNRRLQLWGALVGLATAAVIMHYNFHPLWFPLSHTYAVVFTLTDLVIVSILFLFRSTAVYALLLNSFIAFLGIIIMTDLAIVSELKGWIKVDFTTDPITYISNSMLPYISITLSDFLVGICLFGLTMSDRSAASAGEASA